MSPAEPPNIIIEDAALAQGFVQVPYHVFFDRDLRDGPVRVYGALLWYAWKQRSVPDQASFAQELAMGEERPARQRRERAALIIHGLLQEGFDAATVRAATALAVARQARGPELLPHLVGEAHTRTVAALRQEAATARTDQEQAQAAADRQARYAALDALPEEQRQELYVAGRAAMPYLGDGLGSQAALRAWAADRLPTSNPSPASP